MPLSSLRYTRYEMRGPIAILCLNRPEKRNAIGDTLLAGFAEVVRIEVGNVDVVGKMRLVDVVEEEQLSHGLDVVDHVVDLLGEGVDVFPVERRHEAGVEGAHVGRRELERHLAEMGLGRDLAGARRAAPGARLLAD